MTDSWVYDGFGMVASRTGTTATPFGYGGGAQYQSDAQSGLALLGNRYYDSSVGRFISKDPAKSGSNWFAYCGNNPIAFSDPSGLAYAWYDGEGGSVGGSVSAGGGSDGGDGGHRHWGRFIGGLVGGIAGGMMGGPLGAALGGGLGSFMGSLMDGDDGMTAAHNGAVDGVVGLVGGIAIGKAAGLIGKALGRLGGAVGDAAGGAGEAAGAGKSFYRVAEPAEMESIVAHNAILPSPNGSEVKYFWGSLEEAEQYANLIKSRGWCENPSIIGTQGPGHLFDGPRMMDGISGGYTLPIEHLPRLSPPIIIN